MSAIPGNERAPHKAVIFVRAEVHEVLPTGECSGRPVYKIVEFPLALDGADKNICIRKLNELLAQWKETCK